MNVNRILSQVKDYIDYKHSLGFKLQSEETVLNNFVAFTLAKEYDGPLTREIVLEWVSVGNSSDKTMGRKIEIIRPFSKYVASFDTEAEAIHDRIFRNIHDRPAPYIYTEKETICLMEECKNLYSPDGIRAKTVATVIGLLWSAGLRPSEPVNLQCGDVDLESGILHIRRTKFSKERYVPLDTTVTVALRDYKIWIEEKIGIITEKAPFFYSTNGKPLTREGLSYAFKLIRPCINAKPNGYDYVRLYDFRHTMACNVIRRWMEEGIDVNKNLYILSAFLGHVKPEDTYWYLSATPELLELSCKKYEAMFGGECHEI